MLLMSLDLYSDKDILVCGLKVDSAEVRGLKVHEESTLLCTFDDTSIKDRTRRRSGGKKLSFFSFPVISQNIWSQFSSSDLF